jgi:signal transduction histidine kinase
MMGLRGRLLASYLLLLSITIGLILFAAIFFLNTRPAPEQPTWDDLATLALSINLDDVINQARSGTLLPVPRLGAVTELLGDLARAQSVRILLVTFPNQLVLYDSGSAFERGDRLSGEVHDYPVVVRSTRQYFQPPMVNSVAGNFYESGREWLVFGIPALRSLQGETYYLMFADPRPTQTLQGALSEFGTELLPLLLQAAVVGLLVAVALAFFISRGIARPLQTVAQAAMVVAGGRFNQRVPIKGPREVRAVADAFNRMADEVQSEQQAQQDFLANVSHDLKTPLTSIQGYSQAIMDGAAPNPVAAAKIIYDESARLNRMVVELTDLARLQAGRLSMHMTALDIGQLTEAVAQHLAIVASEKGVQLRIETSPMPEIAGDGDRLEQVLTNLISNAINYTPSGGTVTVRTEIANNGVEVSVADSGVGIAAADLPRIFERFYQVDKARGPRRGTGLGLAIVQEIVQAHGGRITAASAGEGRGSTFTVWLPSPNLTTIMRRR